MRFTLTIMPTGHGVLSTTEELTPEMTSDLRAIWQRWQESVPGLLMVGECDVHLISGQIELEVDMARKSGEDLVDKDREKDLPINRQRTNAGLEPAPEDAKDAPRSMTGDARPEKRG